MKAVGIDIGTTTICGVLLDGGTGELLDSRTLSNDTAVYTENEWEHLQDPEKILEKCRRILEAFQDGEEDIVSVGVTGQMHGILYTDERGRAVSPLYTWQDRRGDLPCRESRNGKEETWAGELSRKTGYPAASGFGLVTHYYHVKNGTVPREAVSLCTIPDYIAMSLAGETRPLMHQSMAASLGLYDLRESCFDQRAIQAAGMDPGILPEVTREHRIVGRLKESAGEGNQSGTCVVSVALGDNQASFLGSVGPEERLLLNVGTGSQISAYTDRLIETGEAECRPYLGETWLIAGSPLCGGYAYSLLKRFVEEIFEMEGTAPADSIYELLNRWAGDVYEQKKREVQVDTRFNGSRKDPGLTGGIFGLTEESFHLGQFALGTLKGICEDLYRYYREFPREVRESTGIVGSGNGIRMNPLLQKICSERFGKEMKIPRYSEEAGYGTALFSLLAGGYYRNLEEAQTRIRYE